MVRCHGSLREGVRAGTQRKAELETAHEDSEFSVMGHEEHSRIDSSSTAAITNNHTLRDFKSHKRICRSAGQVGSAGCFLVFHEVEVQGWPAGHLLQGSGTGSALEFIQAAGRIQSSAIAGPRCWLHWPMVKAVHFPGHTILHGVLLSLQIFLTSCSATYPSPATQSFLNF